MKITIFGIHDKLPAFSSEELEQIAACKHFAGGKRHHEIVGESLPSDAQWHNITVPLQSLFDAIEAQGEQWIVFASGDPLFYGIAITLQREFPNAHIDVKPSFNSLQMLAHRLQLPYGEYRTVTLTGRPWGAFDDVLMSDVAKIALLTDRKKTPKTIAQRMLAAGYDNYVMHLGEKMGGLDEKVSTLSLQEACEVSFQHPNCIYLTQTKRSNVKKGIHESDFETLPGRPNMITKMPIRMTTLSLMGLEEVDVLWDVGACSGSISIETRLNYHHVEVIPFEIRPECEGIVQRNAKRFKVPGLDPIIGDFVKVIKKDLPLPQAAFIGGYGGNMHGVFEEIDANLADGGTVAFNAVSEKSIHAFEQCVEQFTYTMKHKTKVSVDEHNSITIMIAKKECAPGRSI